MTNSTKLLLSDNDHLTKTHFNILVMCWAGWLFDFYDLILYSFLLLPMGAELHFSDMESSVVLGISLAALFAILTGLWIWTFPETKGIKLA